MNSSIKFKPKKGSLLLISSSPIVKKGDLHIFLNLLLTIILPIWLPNYLLWSCLMTWRSMWTIQGGGSKAF